MGKFGGNPRRRAPAKGEEGEALKQGTSGKCHGRRGRKRRGRLARPLNLEGKKVPTGFHEFTEGEDKKGLIKIDLKGEEKETYGSRRTGRPSVGEGGQHESGYHLRWGGGPFLCRKPTGVGILRKRKEN